MSDEIISLTFQIDDGDSTATDQSARQLLSNVSRLDVEQATLVSEGKAPDGAKSADVFTIGALAIAVLPTVLPKVLELFQSWALRGENRRIKIRTKVGEKELEVEYSPTTMTQEELAKLVASINAMMDTK